MFFVIVNCFYIFRPIARGDVTTQLKFYGTLGNRFTATFSQSVQVKKIENPTIIGANIDNKNASLLACSVGMLCQRAAKVKTDCAVYRNNDSALTECVSTDRCRNGSRHLTGCAACR